MAVSGTTQHREFLKVKRLNGLEAWRRIIVPLKPRSEAKRNALHTAVHAPVRSKSLNVIIHDLDDWEKVVEEFELCGGVVTEADRKTVLLKRLPPTTPSSLVSSLRKIPTYELMKADLEAEITFLRDFGPGFNSGAAHVVEQRQEPTETATCLLYTSDAADE